MLKVHSSTVFKEDISCLTPLFSQLGEHEVTQPADPVEMEIIDNKGKGVLVINKFEEMMFQENVKQWIQDTKSLMATTHSIYYIVWG